MKIRSLIVAGAVLAVGAVSAAADSVIVNKHDLNRNGKIEVHERKEYVREVARLRRAEEKQAAALMPKLKPGEYLRIEPPRWTPEKIKLYDANQNGKIDPQ